MRRDGRCCPDSSTRTRTWSSRGSAAPSSRPGGRAAPTRRAASSPRWRRPGPRPTPRCARTCAGWRPRCSARARPRSSASPATASPSPTRPAPSRWPPRSPPRPPTSARTWCRPSSPATCPATWTWCAARCSTRAPRTPAGWTGSARAGGAAPTRRPRSRPGGGAGAAGAAEAAAVLAAGRARGLGARIHANQLGYGPGIRVAAQAGAAAADHCTYLTDADLDTIVSAPLGATLLPGAEFGTRHPYPDARRLLDAGATVALATDCNPGSSFTSSMAFCIALAVRDMRMTTQEAVCAATAGGVRALRRTDVAHLRVGARADLILLDAPSHAYLAYRPGVPQVAAVWQSGHLAAGPVPE